MSPYCSLHELIQLTLEGYVVDGIEEMGMLFTSPHTAVWPVRESNDNATQPCVTQARATQPHATQPHKKALV